MAGNSRLKHSSKQPNGLAEEKLISCTNQAALREFLGSEDQNLNFLSDFLKLSISHNHEGLQVSGQDADIVLLEDLVSQMVEMFENGNQITPEDVQRAARVLAGDRNVRVPEIFKDEINVGGRCKAIVPKTPNQRRYIEAIKSNDIVFGVGPAGTGKTYLAMAMAVSALMKKEVSRVVLTRPAVEAGEKLGFLPGSMAEKVNPYLRPLYDALHDMLDYEKAHELVEKGLIEVAPLAFMRGRTLSKAFVILDEAQNTSQGQMKMLLTRLGERSKCVVTGDVTQVDLPRGVKSGLVDALGILRGIRGIETLYFETVDVIRHPLVAKIISAYDRYERREES